MKAVDKNLDVRDDFKDGNVNFKDPGRRGRGRPEEPCQAPKHYHLSPYENFTVPFITWLMSKWKFFIKLNIAQKRNSKCSNISSIFPFKILNTNSCARLTKCNKTSNMSHKEWVRLLFFVYLNGLLTLRIIPFVKTKKINRFFFLKKFENL